MMTYLLLLLLLFCLFDQPGCQVSFRGLRGRAIKEDELEKIEGQDKLPSLFFSFNSRSTQFCICPPPRRKDGDKNIIKW